MNINLTPEQEEIVKDELRFGQFQTAEEVISQALKRLRERDRSPVALEKDDQRRSAVRDMLDFVEKNRTRLQDITVKHLIHEGHRL
jgi:Arc/MetJ-type ribon-helix-helix transcriptional regulator